ncbi:unnamed protein product [Schistosoma intercalatum]|nr:unnamed protein product [Schistosoma intercalatum]CAH8619761.1 unnamed protein product [Schistosoma intercalatum]
MSAKKPKLPGLNIRGSSSRHDWDSVGTIKFFTDKDGDISGLDEAMRTISMGTRQSGEANVHSPSSHTSDKDSTSYTGYIDEFIGQNKLDVEIAVEATSISESVSPTDLTDSTESAKETHGYMNESSFSQQTNESLGVFSFNNDLNTNSNVLPNSIDVFRTNDRHNSLDLDDSKDISSSAGSHVVHSLKSNVDGNSLKTVLLDEDLNVHLHSNVLPNLTPDCTTTTTPSNILVNPSRINTLSFNTSSNPVNSVMGNQHDTHVPISNDSIKPPINVNIDKTRNVSDPTPPCLSSSKLKMNSSPPTSTLAIDSNDQIFNKVTEPTCIPISTPNTRNSASISRAPLLHSSPSPITNTLSENPQIRQRNVTTITTATTTNTTITIDSNIIPGATGSKVLRSKSHRLSVVKKSHPWMRYTFCSLTVFLIYWLFNGFLLGLTVGCILTYTFVTVYNYLHSRTNYSNQILCPISGLPLDHLCCSLHYRQEQEGQYQGSQWWPIYSPAMPNLTSILTNNANSTNKCMQLRNLPNFTVPNMLEEDVSKSTISGPLGNSLGFKYDNNGRPVYKGWLNEIIHYDPETHHIGKTFSVFLTLDGTQLRLQRPEHNITRRSLWNDEIPSTTTMRFKQQHIYDLTNATVTLLPCGLVGKRLWSRKYPICITVYTEGRFKRKTERLDSLPSSTSFPNIILSTSSNIAVNESSDLTMDTSIPSAGDMEFPDDTSINVLQTSSKSNMKNLYLFGRTCREKETWYRRLKAASLGTPLIWTPQMAVQHYLLASDINNSNNNVGLPDYLSGTATASSNIISNHNDSTLSDDESQPDGNTLSNLTTCSDSAASIANTDVVTTITTTISSNNSNSTPTGLSSTTNTNSTYSSSINLSNYGASIPGNREPVYVSYVRYMAKFMPANWLVRSAQALKLNVNQINCDTNMIWLNALIGRLLWDFLREPYWLEKIKNKIQAKLKKIHLPNFINELTVVDIDLGSEIPVLRRIGCPYLDAHGLWIEVDVGYAGGFSFALETSVNLMRWNQKLREEKDITYSSDNFAQNSLSNESLPKVHSRSITKMAAYLSDEEDSADSTTDSELDETTNISQNSSPINSLRPGRNLPSTGLIIGGMKSGDNERVNPEDNSPVNLQPVLPSRRRIIRIVDRITKSSYFQRAVDTKLVQRGMERLSNTPIVLQVEIQMLSGTLLVNIPPPPSDRLWYGFRPVPNIRLKARPRVGEKVVTMSRILEWIEKKMILEFQVIKFI